MLDVSATAEDINSAFEAAAVGPLRDVLGDPRSCVVSAMETVVHGQVKVYGWYETNGPTPTACWSSSSS